MRRIMHHTYLMIVIIFIGTSAQGNYPLDQSGEESVLPDGLSAERGSALLSMDIKDEPLRAVLERIADQNGITFVLPPSLAEEKVMLRFSNLTLEEALGKILGPYNHIFIYREDQRPSKSSRARLKKVRIFPHQYEGRVQEPLMSIAEGSSESRGAVPSENTEKDRAVLSDEGSGDETYIETLTTTLQEGDADAKLDAVKVLKDAGTVDAVRALSLAMRDKNPTVKREAVSALKAIGSEIIVKEAPANREDDGDTSAKNRPTKNNPRENVDPYDPLTEDDDYEEDNADDEEEQVPRAPSKLMVGLQFGNSANIALSNPEAPVGGVQFKVGGTQVTDVRTTARTEGFLATFDQKSGTVILAGISGQTIPPGNGPIVEIEHRGGRVTISKPTISEKP
jgi:type II secretory pathway component GspD/PulD (secretin)